MDPDLDNDLPKHPKRIRAFAIFFRNYMSVSTIIVAALPIPITAFKAIPIFDDHKSSFMIYTPMFCFLTIGYIFYSRHRLAKFMFPEHINNIRGEASNTLKINKRLIKLIQYLPIILLFVAGILFWAYHYCVDSAVEMLNQEWFGEKYGQSKDYILSKPFTRRVPFDIWIGPLFVCMFIATETAFALMALKEYLQELFKLSDIDIISGK